MTDILIINLLVLVLCIPIVTAGAAFTAMHYVCLKMVRGEEGYITKEFFKSFKLNFRQATIIWLGALLAIVIIAADLYFLIVSGGTEYAAGISGTVILAAIGITAIFLIITLIMVFPVLSHFNNTIKGTIKNAFLLSIVILPKTILMLIMIVLPAALFLFFPITQPICFLFFFSAPAYFSAKLYTSTFKKYEPETEEEVVDDYNWSVLVDEASEEEKTEDSESNTSDSFTE